MKHFFSFNILTALVFIFFLALYGIIYTVTTYDKELRIKQELKLQTENLSHNYSITTSRFNIITDNVTFNILNDSDILDLLYKAKHTKDTKKLSSLRLDLYKKMKPIFEHLKKFGVNIILFSFENNKTFLRVHKPSKFDDDLSKVRYSFKYVNSFKKPIRGFEQGKISHAFRNIFPIFLNNEYLGIMA